MKGITYINIPGKLPEIETVSRLRDAFFKAHLYSDSTAEDALMCLAFWKAHRNHRSK